MVVLSGSTGARYPMLMQDYVARPPDNTQVYYVLRRTFSLGSLLLGLRYPAFQNFALGPPIQHPVHRS